MKLSHYKKEKNRREFAAFKEQKKLDVQSLADLLGYSKESIYKKLSGEVAVSPRDLLLIKQVSTELDTPIQ